MPMHSTFLATVANTLHTVQMNFADNVYPYFYITDTKGEENDGSITLFVGKDYIMVNFRHLKHN
jgi:hypothetical protein